MGNDGNETPFVPTVGNVPIVSIVSFVPIVSTVPTVRNVPIVLFVPAVRIVPIVPNVPFVPYRKNVPVVPFVSGVPDNSPLSLAALTGVSPAPPRGEPSVRASIMVNCTVRQSCEQVCLTTSWPPPTGVLLPPPVGEVAQDAQADCDGEGNRQACLTGMPKAPILLDGGSGFASGLRSRSGQAYSWLRYSSTISSTLVSRGLPGRQASA